MRPSSSNSVKIRSVDPAVIITALKRWASVIRRKKPVITAVGYFGSYATNRYSPGSDLDVLVILSESPYYRFFDRIPEFYPKSFPVGMDLFIYTEDEIKKMKSDANPWINHLLNEIRWIYHSQR